MSFTYQMFHLAAIPLYEAEQDISTLDSVLPSIATSNGEQYDQLGTDERANPAPTSIQVRGEIVATSLLNKTTQRRTLTALRGIRDQLFRTEDGTSATHWMWARVKQVQLHATTETTLIQPFTLEFKLYSAYWHGQRFGAGRVLDSGYFLDTGYYLDEADSHTLTANALTTLTYTNDGDTDYTAPIVTITNPAGGTSITNIALTAGPDASTTEVTWAYTATLAANQALVIDCGEQTVKKAGVDDYAHFSATSSVIDDWLRIYSGNTTIKITLTGGGSGGNAATVVVAFDEAWQ